jgi:hypothetical protein
VHPSPSPAWANFTLMIECTPESSVCYSMYSVVSSVLNHTFVPEEDKDREREERKEVVPPA